MALCFGQSNYSGAGVFHQGVSTAVSLVCAANKCLLFYVSSYGHRRSLALSVCSGRELPPAPGDSKRYLVVPALW